MSETLGLITYKSDRRDSRIKLAVLTDKGEELSFRLAGSFKTQEQRAAEKKDWDGELLQTQPEVRARSKNVDPILDVLQLENAFATEMGIPVEEMNKESDRLYWKSKMRDWLASFAIDGESEAIEKSEEEFEAVKNKLRDKQITAKEADNQHDYMLVKSGHMIELARRARRLIASKKEYLMISEKTRDERPAYASKLKEFLDWDIAEHLNEMHDNK
jgi:hypothetical protein